MNFGANHYVPILKVKRGEKMALQSISPTLQGNITPLLEIVERTGGKPVDAHLDTAFTGLADSIQSYSRCFLDTLEIAPDGPMVAEEIFRRAFAAGILFTPVTGINRTADIAAALNHQSHGIAIRLTRNDFEKGSLHKNLLSFMNQHGLATEETDLIVDLGPVEDLIVNGVNALTESFVADVPVIQQWRTFTISACAFPLSMGVINRHSHDLIKRSEWISWRDYLHTRRQKLPRHPTFSDCAIQHPKGVEGFDPRIMQVSASVRYTSGKNWLLIKGESTRNVPAKEQFPKLASLLVFGHLKSHFKGENHCKGCALIKEAADGVKGLGSAEVWRRLGTIHHITTVVQELASLPSP